MTTDALIAKAEEFCCLEGVRFPTDLRQLARQWQRKRFDLEFCWRQI
jgi:hypothetical protein